MLANVQIFNFNPEIWNTLAKIHINAIVRLKDSGLLFIFFLSISDYPISM